MTNADRNTGGQDRAAKPVSADERLRRQLVGDMRQRTRNVFALLRAIMRRTAETAESLDDYVAHLDGRLGVLARIATDPASSSGAGLELAVMLSDELQSVTAREGINVSLAGPSVRLHDRAAETMALALHELATNAVKFGALAVTGGRLDVSWAIQDGDIQDTAAPMVVLTWTELGCASPARDEPRRGFGTVVLQDMLPDELGARTALSLRADGLTWRIEIPLAASVTSGPDSGADSSD